MITACVAHIVIVDSSAIICEGLTSILSKSGLKLCISKAETFEELNLIHLKRNCDIAIINPILIQNNLKPFQNLKNELLKVKWIGNVYAYYEPQIMSIFDAIIRISDNTDSIISNIKKQIDSDNQKDTSHSIDVLSDREIDVLKLLATGMANKEIAEKLNISINTVITHRKNISQKTGIKSVSGLTIYAVVQKLISLNNINDNSN